MNLSTLYFLFYKKELSEIITDLICFRFYSKFQFSQAGTSITDIVNNHVCTFVIWHFRALSRPKVLPQRWHLKELL